MDPISKIEGIIIRLETIDKRNIEDSSSEITELSREFFTALTNHTSAITDYANHSAKFREQLLQARKTIQKLSPSYHEEDSLNKIFTNIQNIAMANLKKNTIPPSSSSSSSTASLETKEIKQSSLPSVKKPEGIDVKTASLEEIKKALALLTREEIVSWVNFPDPTQREKTPLAIAVEAHDLVKGPSKMDIIAFFIDECGADPNIGDKDNWTPLYRSATETRTDAMTFLLAHGANVNVANNDGSTPLHRLVDRNDMIGCQILLDNRARVNALNVFGTPLAYAAKNGNLALATLLLENGADPNLVADPLATPPLAIAKNNKKNEVALLLEYLNAFDTPPIDSPAHTSLSRAVFNGDAEQMMASFKAQELDQYGRSVAHYCAYLGLTEHLKQMRSMGDIDVPDKMGRTPLHYAVMRGHAESVKYMTSDEGQCRLNIQDLQGYSPLMWACQYNQEGIARTLLAKPKNDEILTLMLNTKDKFGWKPIHKAAHMGNVELLYLFIKEYRVNPNEPTANGRTCLDLATTTGAWDAIKYLKAL